MYSKRQETNKKSASRNIRFIQAALSVVRSTKLSLYSGKYSKKIFTQHQLLTLVLFRDFRNQHYREFIEDVGDMERVQEILGLPVIPHFTTLQKFLCRIKSLYLRLTFKKTVNLFYSTDEVIPITAIDSSGFTSGYCSHYFSERTGKIRKHFLKTSISVDTEQQVITGFVASNSRVHDTRHAVKLLRQCHSIRKSDCYVMDRGYDSEAIHRLIRQDLHANSVIPIRSWNNEIISGIYRQEMAHRFNDVVYPRRQLVENKFSVLKRKFNGDLKARKFLIQMKEIAGKVIVCNIHRFLQFLMREVFYRANMEQFAILGDELRNPLTVIIGLADLIEDASLAQKVIANAREIDSIITKIDHGWIESEKVREFMKKYYDIGIRGTHELVARAIHEEDVARQAALGIPSDTNPSLLPWNQLPPALRETTLQQAEDIAKKLLLINCGIGIAIKDVKPVFTFTDEEVEQLAEEEHNRWMKEKGGRSWTHGLTRLDPDHVHNGLVPWNGLTEAEKEKDRHAIRALPAILAKVHLKVFRLRLSEG